uniref:UPF0235 protein BECKLFY1418A_GA0070994_11223 n=1 Tax=Candidatus Kentrum sp. LFY TaxID=2126342 RepID=A0A450URH8_9GAMM|nr:MAG: TIGR00251 family protein [Candidatus Kentron sp. LFY]VFK00678.1 MAG: TIGR00251 family protein [Candidatus Kentron sp. LFY]
MRPSRNQGENHDARAFLLDSIRGTSRGEITMPWFREQQDTLILEIQVQPRASRNEIVGIQGDRLKLRVTAAPVDGKGNEQVMKFLAREFRVPKSCLTVLAGARSRNKRIGVRAPYTRPVWMRAFG